MFSIRKWLFDITATMPCRLISRIEGEPYLERYYIGELFGVTFYLHRFVQPDADEELHDHPWSWMLSLILCGEYRETVIDAFNPTCGYDCTTHQRKWFNFFRAGRFHRILFATPETWTLFIHGKRIKRWGFVKSEHVAKEEYTVTYTGYPPSNPYWFNYAMTGEQIGRAPYNGGPK